MSFVLFFLSGKLLAGKLTAVRRRPCAKIPAAASYLL
jgi:hypothetical protein